MLGTAGGLVVQDMVRCASIQLKRVERREKQWADNNNNTPGGGGVTALDQEEEDERISDGVGERTHSELLAMAVGGWRLITLGLVGLLPACGGLSDSRDMTGAVDTPITPSPSSSRTKGTLPCALCGKLSIANRCTGCLSASYCSREHQKQHWYVNIPISLYLYIPISLYPYIPISLYLYISISLSLYISISLYLYTCISLSLYISISLSFFILVHPLCLLTCT